MAQVPLYVPHKYMRTGDSGTSVGLAAWKGGGGKPYPVLPQQLFSSFLP
jgi:hypothetical protein